MLWRTLISALLIAAAPALAASASFGKLVVVGGHPSDIAFDDRRQQVYIANYTGMRVDVVSAPDGTLKQPLRVDSVPASIALSPDNRFLVVAHANAPGTFASVTAIDLDRSTRSVLWLPAVPLAVAFGNSGRAVILTTAGLYLLDPLAVSLEQLPAPQLACEQSPVVFGTFPSQITRAAAGVSGDGNVIVFAAEYKSDAASDPGTTAGCNANETVGNDAMVIRYEVASGTVSAAGVTATPALGPRVVSVNQDGTRYMAGWGLFDQNRVLLAQFPYATGSFSAGGHAFDPHRNIIYSQVPSSVEGGDAAGPLLSIMDGDNLAVQEQLRIPENLAGKAVFSADGSAMYALSDSGIVILPLGSLDQAPRVYTRQEQLFFSVNSCAAARATQTIEVVNPSGGQTDFTISVPNNIAGLHLSATAGRTPASITVEIDPALFRTQPGTTAIPITIASPTAVNVIPPVRLLVNAREPDQRGTVYPVPGKIVDILGDPARNWVYLLRQDKNQVIVLEASSMRQLAALKTGNTPMQMTLAANNRYLMVANDNSQIINVYNLDNLAVLPPVVLPFGHYARSIAAGKGAILAMVRNVAKWPKLNPSEPPAMIDRISLLTFTAAPQFAPPAGLGIYANNLPIDSVMVPSPSGFTIFTAMADGTLLLYDDLYDTFVTSRKDGTSLSGAISAISDDLFSVGAVVYNRSLTHARTLPAGSPISGAVERGAGRFLTFSAGMDSGPGLVQTMSAASSTIFRPLRTAESPLTSQMLTSQRSGQVGLSVPPFLRTATMMRDGTAFYLSVSGVTALPPSFDDTAQTPTVVSVANLADGGTVAPGSLIRITGEGLSSGLGAASATPLPLSLADMCVAVNGFSIPLVTASPGHVEAQMPFDVTGPASLTVSTPGGKSTPFNFQVASTAPAIFRSVPTESTTDNPLVYRAANNDVVAFSNPVHAKDVLIFIATGLGNTSNEPASGSAAPSDPLAVATTPVQVSIGNTPLTVTYAGLLPGQVGVYQINAAVPWNISGATQVPLTITQGSSSVTFPVRVVNP